MRALDRKLLRDLWRMRGQALTIALVVACGVASLVGSLGTFRSLETSRDSYYERYRFADVFAGLKRAPEAVAARIAEIPGVALVETRIVHDVLLDVPGMPEPVVARLVSVPAREPPRLNAWYLRRGRELEPGRAGEALVSEAFARAHGLRPGDALTAVLNGRREVLRVAGFALTPEYVFAMRGGALYQDDRRFGLLWMDRAVLAPAFQMEGAFNDVALRLQPGASREAVIERLDLVLEPYGGTGAYGRDRQGSDRFVSQELEQLRVWATVAPVIFLAVAAFLINVVLSRVIGTQREQIAALKALGYSNTEVGTHFLELALVVVVAGAALGVGLGHWLGNAMTRLYTQYFRFPLLVHRTSAEVVAYGVLASVVPSIAVALLAVRAAARLPPAEAMRPQAPPAFHPSRLERAGLHRLLAPAARMVLRDLERRPLRAAFSMVGIALATAILVVGSFSTDAVEFLVQAQFERAQRDDLTVSFVRPLPARAVRELAHLPGVRHAEPVRTVPVRLRAAHRVRYAAVTGLPPGGDLRRVVGSSGAVVPVPREGLLLSTMLARVLGVGVGATVRVERLDGDRRAMDLPVTALADEMMGLGAYMDADALARALREEPTADAAALALEPGALDGLLARLKTLPRVAGVGQRSAAIRYFREETTKFVVVYTLILAAFGGVIAIGVVYNNARIALSVRARDLASLRVLGFTRTEVSAVLLGEQAVQVIAGIPAGLALGHAMAAGMLSTVDAELFRMPLVILPRTYTFAAAVVLGAAVVSALLVRRRIDRLDLVGVLKSRD